MQGDVETQVVRVRNVDATLLLRYRWSAPLAGTAKTQPLAWDALAEDVAEAGTVPKPALGVVDLVVAEQVVDGHRHRVGLAAAAAHRHVARRRT